MSNDSYITTNQAGAHLVWHHTTVTREMRARALQQSARCIWLTGLSGAGKSTLANALDSVLHEHSIKTMLLDGDNVRQGLCKDLGMSDADRTENIRRVAEVAKLMVDAGIVVITAFISPFRSDRDGARQLFPEGEFIEIFVDTSLQECEKRDPKGLYRKARSGVIKNFTGIDSPYEAPESPEIVIRTDGKTLEQCVGELLESIDINLQPSCVG